MRFNVIRTFCTQKLKRPFAEDVYTWRVHKKQYADMERKHKDSMFHMDMQPIKYLEFFRQKTLLHPKDLWNLKKTGESYVREMQQGTIPERNRALGNDLSTAHFVLFFDGKIRLVGESDWITKKSNEQKQLLPQTFDPDYKVEEIDFSDVEIYFEGLVNLSQLKYLKKLYFRNCHTITDWCLNRISAMFPHRLQSIDLRGCKNITYRGLGTFHLCKELQHIHIDNRNESDHMQLVCLMLEEMNPLLTIDSESNDIGGAIKKDDDHSDNTASER